MHLLIKVNKQRREQVLIIFRVESTYFVSYFYFKIVLFYVYSFV